MTEIILGDLHHGRRHKVTYGDPAIWDYKSISILNRLINKHNPDRLVLAGDIFDTSKPTALAYSELAGVIARIPEVIIIAGNHDISRVNEDIAFNNLAAFDNVKLVGIGEYDKFDYNLIAVGWQQTQQFFKDVMTDILTENQNKVIVTHCSRLDFGNENDNILTDELIALAKDNGNVIVSGHEHKAALRGTFNHLGSVVPHSIAEVGTRYYWLNGKFLELPDDGDIILTREEPITINSEKCYYVKPGKEITTEDLLLEEKDLSIDIVSDFWEKAQEAGFKKELLND
jgi:DNA repair exonuclease SbcCD nuclease subunit